jgi:hypothetical protein
MSGIPNPPVAVSALLAPSTADAVVAVIVNSLVTMGVRADLWPEEDAAYCVVVAVANVISSGIDSRAQAIGAAWLPTSAGGWLQWLALYMYGVYKTLVTFATGQLTLTNGGGGTYAFAPSTATFQNPTTKATYTNTTAIALGPGPGTTQAIDVQATVVGSASNSAPGTITGIVTTMLGVTCSNAGPVLGIDQQTDPSLQLECWNAIAANSAYGPRQSIAYAIQQAVNAVTGSPVNINRWLLSPSSHTGQVTVTVASPAGIADPNDVTGVANEIEAIARPMNVQVITQSATALPITQTLTCYVTATPGLLAVTVQLAIETALAALFESYAVGGLVGASAFQGFFASALEGACTGAWPPHPTDPTIPWQSAVYDVSGASDVAMVVPQVAVDEISVVVVLTSPVS